LFVVKNKDGTLRLCIEYKQINKDKVKNKYPFLRIFDLFEKLKGENIFSKIDLRLLYHQVRIKEQDISKTYFITSYENYEFVVVPFGLTNAPTIFILLMNDIFRNYLDRFFIMFLHNILTYSKLEEEHVHYLKLVLQVIMEHQLYGNMKKYYLYHEKVFFL
jgi:hypothetical protein